MRNFILPINNNGNCNILGPLLMDLQSSKNKIVKMTIINPFSDDNIITPLIEDIKLLKDEIDFTYKLQVINYYYNEDQYDFINRLLDKIDDKDILCCDLSNCSINLALSIFNALIDAYVYKHASVENVLCDQIDVTRLININTIRIGREESGQK